MNVEIDPEIMNIIQNSTAVSTQKGSSAHLLKVGSKRRRTRAEIEEIKLNEMDRMAHQASQEQRIRELEQEVRQSKSKVASASKAENVLNQMLDAGFVVENEDGEFVPGAAQQQEEM